MKTNQLTGHALNWAVSMAENWAGADFEVKPYSTDWAQGGLIIEAWMIDVCTYRGAWRAARHVGSAPTYGYGTTPLIAAMRCYVASKLGDEVEIPKELKE